MLPCEPYLRSDIYIDEINKIWSKTRHRPEIAYMVGKQKICPLEDEFRGESVYAGCSRLREWTKNYVSSRIGKSNASIYDPASDNMPEEEPGYRTFCPYYLRSREGFELNGTVHFRRSSSCSGCGGGLEEEDHTAIPTNGILPGNLSLRDHEPLCQKLRHGDHELFPSLFPGLSGYHLSVAGDGIRKRLP